MQSNVLIALIIYTSLHCILLRNNIQSLNKSLAGYSPNYTLCQCMNVVMRYAENENTSQIVHDDHKIILAAAKWMVPSWRYLQQ